MFKRCHPALRKAKIVINGAQGELYILAKVVEDHMIESACGTVSVFWPLSHEEYSAQPEVKYKGQPTDKFSIKLNGKKNKRMFSLV